MLNALIDKTRSTREIALAVASSGIASLILHGGRTVHSRFKVPLNITKTSVCDISKRSNGLLELLKRTKLIVWDEISMQHKHVIECVDRTLRDLLSNNEFFGGITVVFAGGWKQILPVVRNGGKAQILAATFRSSKKWPFVQQCTLLTNMRIKLYGTDDERELLQFQRAVGNKTAGERSPSCEDYETVEIPREMVSNSKSVEDFTSEILMTSHKDTRTQDISQIGRC